eukprot:CAMPEP_0180806024 /NCGR_PEP_ID=MMETSP1038_2-20121128/62357_1 /TAXON_ID=632150 /ORGANISM="Azadinium spinosum, Strain 3D9" /LENGTH=46 /DNA_ID= /DNA_START= /DNA_END= /DNA_ORIENTATION=
MSWGMKVEMLLQNQPRMLDTLRSSLPNLDLDNAGTDHMPLVEPLPS